MAFVSRIGRALRQAAKVSSPLGSRGADARAVLVPALHLFSRGMASSKLFVGGLSWGADENTLREAFSSYGEVIDVRIITDRDTGRSRGFGFVSFTNDTDAESALQAMDGRNLAGRTIRVDYAVQKPAGMGRGPGGFGGGSGGFGGGSGGFGSGFGGGMGATGGTNAKRDGGGFGMKNDFDLDLDLLGTKSGSSEGGFGAKNDFDLDLDLLGTKSGASGGGFGKKNDIDIGDLDLLGTKKGSLDKEADESNTFDDPAKGLKDQ